MKMEEVSEKRFADIMSKSLHLSLCPICKQQPDIVIKIPTYGIRGAAVRCTKCGFETGYFPINSQFATVGKIGTPVIESSLMSGILEAIKDWNRRADNG